MAVNPAPGTNAAVGAAARRIRLSTVDPSKRTLGIEIVKLPYAENVWIEPEKVRDYLLSPTHPVGKFKAAYFTGLGYRQDQWPVLAEDLRTVATRQDAVPGQPSQFGHKYEIPATLTGPSGKSARIVTIWMVRHGEQVARFVTATPGAKP